MSTTDSEHSEEETTVDEDEETVAQFPPIIKLEEVTGSTGEENEDAILDLKAKLYRFDKNENQWKKRGDGSVRILKHKETGRVRLVMRQSETMKICANHFVIPSSLVRKHDGNEMSCVWRAADFAEGELRDELFCIRFLSTENMDSQDQGHMRFASLLSQDSHFGLAYDGKSGISYLDDFPPLPPNNPSGVRKSGRASRGVNFTLEEDKILVSAWLHCCIDGVHGTDQKHSQLWEKISEYFHQFKKTPTERTIKSLINRWSLIHKATNKFRAQLAQVEESNKSGMSEQAKFLKAKIMYQSLEKCNFQFEHCWNLLKDQPKWISRVKVVSRQRKAMFPSPTPIPTPCSADIDDSIFDLETGNVIENEVIEFDRPMERKAEKRKQKARQIAKNFQLRKKRFTLLEDSRALEKEFYRLKAEKMEYDKEKEEKMLRLDDERLRLEAEKLRIEAEKAQSKIRQEDERLRLEAEKIELSKKESDLRIMMMDVSAMSEMQQLYIEGLQREIMRRSHILND